MSIRAADIGLGGLLKGDKREREAGREWEGQGGTGRSQGSDCGTNITKIHWKEQKRVLTKEEKEKNV